MSSLRFRYPVFFVFLWASALQTVCAQRPLRIVEWNVENLFDCRHDTLKDDFEFLPEGERRWTWSRYWRKLTDVSRVLMAIGDDAAPDLVGLCEVENDSVLTDLCRRSSLRNLDFSYVMTQSADRRGMDVALLYRPARFRLLDWHAVRVPSREHALPATRDILWVKGLAPGGDTLHVVVCHLPSRLGGRAGQRGRRLAVGTLNLLADSIGEGGNLVVLGDFNAPPHDKVFRKLTKLVNLVPQKRYPSEGTYRYKGLWSWIDHALVSPALVSVAGPVYLYTAPWLQDKDSHGGWHPRRTFMGTFYHGGVSDHVPLWFDLHPLPHHF